MIQLRPANERGHSDHDGMQSDHSFAYALIQTVTEAPTSVLKTLNEDWIQPGEGLKDQSAHDVEIISYILEGALEHRDNLGNETVVRPGDLQLLSAGSGVLHSELNASQTDPLHYLRICLTPDCLGLEPSYEQRHFQREDSDGRILLLASPDGSEGSLTVHQDARMFNVVLNAGEVLRHNVSDGRKAYLHIARGTVVVNDQVLQSGDGASISDVEELRLTTPTRGEALLFDLP